MAPPWITRIIQISLGLHGALHFVELGTALYETAYITASLAAFGTLTMILGAVLLEPEERAHHH
ncbi:MAG: hypothetical protein VX571_01920 [Candidatus Thermoplasmatota archaeon]|jgi:hypothetical protein|nr:hypothetical protein [Candidatus Thermoplasmatota archaeon]